MTMGPEPSTRIFEMSARLGIYCFFFLSPSPGEFTTDRIVKHQVEISKLRGWIDLDWNVAVGGKPMRATARLCFHTQEIKTGRHIPEIVFAAFLSCPRV